MPDWNTRLEVTLGTTPITPITSISPTFTVPHTVLHSIESDNVGVVRQPVTITFTMAIPALATAVADLTAFALTGQEFEISVTEATGDDWAFKSIKFSRCLVTSATPSNVVIDGVPQANFTCMALSVAMDA